MFIYTHYMLIFIRWKTIQNLFNLLFTYAIVKSLYLTISIIALILLGSFIFYQTTRLAPEIPKTKCETLQYADPQALNLLFFTDKPTAESYLEAFFSIPPFDTHRNAFNIYQTNEPVTCTLYKEIALFCHSKELLQMAAECPNDFIIVPKVEPVHIRSSSFQNILSINLNNPRTAIAHEFAHAFLNLDEEYVPATPSFLSKNCKATCTSFNGLEDSCKQGCSSSDRYRSIDKGLMRTLSVATFGSFNEQLFTNALQLHQAPPLTGNIVQEDCAEQYYYLFHLYRTEDTIQILEKTKEQGCASFPNVGDLRVSLSSDLGEILFLSNFDRIYTDTQLPGAETLEGEVFEFVDRDFYLRIPDNIDASTLTITDENDKVLTAITLKDEGARLCTYA